MASDMEPRLLRVFVAVAEELHFTRAAARLYLAQQALSRDVRRLERELGVDLFVRTTRQVALTVEGERLLPYARRVLGAQDELAAAFRRDAERPLLVDVGAPVGTAYRVLEEARARVPESCELVARFHSGLTGAAGELAAGRLDVSFGRFAGLPPGVRAGLVQQPVRLEPMAVLLPEDHPLAARPAVPLAELAGETLYAGAGNAGTAEWTDLAARLFDGRGIAMAEPFPEIEGSEEFVRVVRKRGWSVLASVEFIEVPGMVLRPVVDPVPLSPVSMVWRKGLRHPGLEALRAAARELGEEGAWLASPGGGPLSGKGVLPEGRWWLPEEDAAVMGAGARRGGDS
ncbi:LysR family transcriptional regulator [Streptomyces gilvosporeus]|uniref:LysR family transcriptional regulator n=1 Tax=Streptomyces gilvosporeus TaxID=553510 RepID=A0A1V0TRG9_9ACTN|nr:LysR family transcriptional regulator [Streptomyces gilvosporeus]ARF55546.1 LysR family transcriptional regulator [Streptomyces gilvosporeus]